MMLYIELHPNGEFFARHDTVGFEESEALHLCDVYRSKQASSRLAILQENMRHAVDMIAMAEPAGRA